MVPGEFPELTIPGLSTLPELDAPWDEEHWAPIQPTLVSSFHPKSLSHRPLVQVKMVHDGDHLQVGFRVEDRFVRAVNREYQSAVYEDSCVEIFVQPTPTGGYFNFEVNAIGTLLLSHIRDPRRTDDGFADFDRVTADRAACVGIWASLGSVPFEEVPGPLVWQVTIRIPAHLVLLRGSKNEVISAKSLAGSSWRGNLQKCADRSSVPHWGSWAPIGEALNFHQPENFGIFRFGPMP